LKLLPFWDPLRGDPRFEKIVASLAPERAITALEKLLSVPYQSALAERVPLTPALLRLDPMFDPLRNDPLFQKLIAEPPAN
jgi:hypothetical protein